MMYIRGNRKDYDSWAKLGNEGWDYDSIEKYFHKIEKVQSVNFDTKYGKDGEISIQQNRHEELVWNAMKASIKKLGLNYYDEEVPIGYFIGYNNIKNGIRQSASKAYIADKEHRSNLFIATKAQVAKIIISSDLQTVLGVEVKVRDEIIQVFADKEVILSGGAINSPQILMNSGNRVGYF